MGDDSDFSVPCVECGGWLRYVYDQAMPHTHLKTEAVTALPQPDNNEIPFVVRNIVNQLGDMYSERIPSDRWVEVRQATNDMADQFVSKLLNSALAAARKEGARIALTAAADDGLLDEGPEVIAHIMALPEYGICDESFKHYLTGPHDEDSPPTEKSE